MQSGRVVGAASSVYVHLLGILCACMRCLSFSAASLSM